MSHSLYGFVCALLICAGMSPILSALFGGSNSSIEWLSPIVEDTWISDSSYYSLPSGSGTESSPYLITEAGELAYFAANGITSDTYISLSNSIDLSDHTWVPIDVSSGVTVTLSGNLYSISKIKVYNTTYTAGGIFGTVSGTLNVTELYIYNADITSTGNAGALVGYMASGTLKQVYTRGSVTSLANNAGGIAGYCAGTIKNCFNWASVQVSKSYAGGLVGYLTGSVIASYNYGDITAVSYAGGVAGYSTGTIETSMATDCMIVCPSYVGGVAGCGTTITSSGFRGSIYVPNSTASCIGSICGSEAVISYCFGVAEITFAYSTSTSAVYEYGAPKLSTYYSTYSYVTISTSASGSSQEYRKYAMGGDEAEVDAFSTFIYSPYVNGGFPFPAGVLTAGFSSDDVYNYLIDYGFETEGVVSYEILKDSTTGWYYIEYGSYPQTYVGDEMNATLESWYTTAYYSDTYTLTVTTSLTKKAYEAYKYSDGNTYVRIPSATPYTTGYTFNDETSTTITSGSTYWFKVEPIKWIILNPTTYDSDGYLYLLSWDCLAANIPFYTDTSTTNRTLWTNSKIRTWLNSYFIYDAFSDDELENINQNVTIANNTTSSTTDGSGTSTTDTSWLLSYYEVATTYTSVFSTTSVSSASLKRRVSPSDFALANRCYIGTDYTNSDGYYSSIWWLRSAYSSSGVRCVDYPGNVSYSTIATALYFGIRPALQLSL